MYVPKHFEESRVDVMHALIRAHPLAVLVTLGPAGLNANHLPIEIDPEPAPFGTLRGHVARANPVWRDPATEVEALVVFQGPARYITPAWYPTKRETGEDWSSDSRTASRRLATSPGTSPTRRRASLRPS